METMAVTVKAQKATVIFFFFFELENHFLTGTNSLT